MLGKESIGEKQRGKRTATNRKVLNDYAFLSLLVSLSCKKTMALTIILAMVLLDLILFILTFTYSF